MTVSNQLVVFAVDDQQYALNLDSVERVVRAVEITHLPQAPEGVLGVINFEGRVIPVINTRQRLGLPERELDLQDLFIIAQQDGVMVAFVGDEVRPVVEMPQEKVVASEKVLPGTGYVRGVAKIEDGMIIVLGVSEILTSDERDRVRKAIEAV